jgi:hypothetical protein
VPLGVSRQLIAYRAERPDYPILVTTASMSRRGGVICPRKYGKRKDYLQLARYISWPISLRSRSTDLDTRLCAKSFGESVNCKSRRRKCNLRLSTLERLFYLQYLLTGRTLPLFPPIEARSMERKLHSGNDSVLRDPHGHTTSIILTNHSSITDILSQRAEELTLGLLVIMAVLLSLTIGLLVLTYYFVKHILRTYTVPSLPSGSL